MAELIYGDGAPKSALTLTIDSGILSSDVLVGPGHSWRIVGDAEAALRVQQDHSTMAVQAGFQINDGLVASHFRSAAFAHAVGGALGQHQLHDWLAPSGAGGGGALVVGIAAASDQ